MIMRSAGTTMDETRAGEGTGSGWSVQVSGGGGERAEPVKCHIAECGAR